MAIKRTELEERVLGALKNKLMDPGLFKEFCDEFTREMNRLRIEGRASLEAAQLEVKRIDRELDTLLNLILKGNAAERINAKMVQLEAHKEELQRALAEAEQPLPLLHPEMASFYREQVTGLHLVLGDGDDKDRAEAAERLRSLVSKIVLTPEDGTLAIDVHGDLAGILAIAHATPPSARSDGAPSERKPPLGTRGRLPLPESIGRPGGAAYLTDLAQQVKLVAGAGFEPATFRL
jgi:hypothetical protein